MACKFCWKRLHKGGESIYVNPEMLFGRIRSECVIRTLDGILDLISAKKFPTANVVWCVLQNVVIIKEK
jgi:hypothetical protein